MSLCTTFQSFPTFVIIKVLENVDWNERAVIMCSNKKFYEISTSDAFYMWCCQRLAIENGVYSNHAEVLVDCWKKRFVDLFQLRRIWTTSDVGERKVQPHSSYKPDAAETEAKKFKINVYARFRPKLIKKQRQAGIETNDSLALGDGDEDGYNDDDNDTNANSISLPLHQRIALVKMSNKLTSTKAALKVLTEEGEWFDKKWKNKNNNDCNNLSSDVGEDENSENNFTMFSSVNLNSNSQSQDDMDGEMNNNNNININKSSNNNNGMVASVQTIDPGTSRVIMLAPEVGLREFVFDGVFPQSTSQKYFYDTSIKKLVIDFMNGFNTTAVVFGQTGSGKTYSMFGADDATPDAGVTTTDHHCHSSNRGIIPRACVEVLTAVAERTVQNKITSNLSVSYVEVFGDQIFDLLRNGTACGHSKVAAQRYVLSGAAERVVHSLADIEEVLRVGGAQKRFAATAMNDRSSRAHTVFILSLKQTKECPVVGDSKITTALELKASKFTGAKTIRSKVAKTSPDKTTTALNNCSKLSTTATTTTKLLTKTSKFFFADLGGSEQVKKSLVDEQSGRVHAVGFEKADRMREAIYINLGLLALKKCVDAINNGIRYVPYQESKLTMLLSEGLGGNSKTSIVVCASMDNKHATESLATLRFGEKCASVVTEARGSGHSSSDSSMLESVLADLDQRIAQCEADIRAKERWEVRQEVREDVLAEDNTVESAQGRKEVKNVSVLVGAENERRLLVQLLNRKASLSSSSSSSSTLNNNKNKKMHTVSNYSSINDGGINSDSSASNLNSSSGVVGFGKAYAGVYGLGSEYDPATESQQLNERFTDAVSESRVPQRVKARGVAGWTAAEALAVDAAVLEQKAKTIKRNKLVYSGLS